MDFQPEMFVRVKIRCLVVMGCIKVPMAIRRLEKTKFGKDLVYKRHGVLFN